MIEWETGEITDEPLSTVATNDPMACCALYSKDNDFLELKGWKWFKLIAKRQLNEYNTVSICLCSHPENGNGNGETLSHYVDANFFFHELLTGRSVTGIRHFVNKTSSNWYSKKQGTVEYATYRSEFVEAPCTWKEQIIELRTTFRYLGVAIRNKSSMFGANKSVVDSSMTHHVKLSKRHMALSLLCVRQTIAREIIGVHHMIPGEDDNPADILSKHWGYQQVWKLLQPLLFWQGNTLDILKLDPKKNTKNGNKNWHG